MRIGFDGKRAVQNYTGLGNYSRYLVEIVSRFYPEHEYRLYAPKKRSNSRLEKLLETSKQVTMVYPQKAFWKKLSAIWRILGITRQLEEEKVDLFHGLSNELPLQIHHSRIKSIVTIHDLIFLRFPQYYPCIDRQIYAYKFRKACEHADRIIAISECTKRDIIDFFHIPASKIDIVYQGCDPIFEKEATAEEKEAIRTKYQLPKRFILNVGSIESRKNVLLTVKAMASVPADVHLVIVGKRTPYTHEVEQYAQANGLIDRVHIFSNIPFLELPIFYQCAEVFTYPSYFEGFGIPIIEALHSGVPVIAATGSCLEEAGGPNSLYVHPDKVDEMIHALHRVLNEPALQQEMIAKGKEYVQRFSAQEQASAIMEIYQKTCRES